MDRLAVAWQARQARLAARAARRAQAMWRAADRGSLRGSWSATVPATLEMVTAAQTAAAGGAQNYVSAQVHAQGATPQPEGTVRASTLAGVASDGRDLSSLLDYPAFQVGYARTLGMPPDEAFQFGEQSLMRIVVTQVADAARVGTSVAMVNDQTVIGYIREVAGRGCSRCAVLAGQFYRYNTGFQRHPNCQCVHVPITRGKTKSAADRARDSPQAYFNSLSAADQDRVFTRAGAQAIRDGADPARVVNARRGMSTAAFGRRQIQATNEGVTRFGAAGQRASQLGFRYTRVPRLMPEQIYAEATSRADAIRLLYRYGYIQ